MLRIYGPAATRTFRAIWTAEELGLEYEHVKIDLKSEAKSQEFLEKHPMGKVPVLEHDGRYLFESAAICIYLADLRPEMGLMPEAGSFERGQANQWIHFAMTEFESHLWFMAKHNFVLPEAWRVPDVTSTCIYEFYNSLDVVIAQLSKNDFILGDKFSVADILVCQTLLWARKVDGIEINSQTVKDYMERMKAREKFPDIKKFV